MMQMTTEGETKAVVEERSTAEEIQPLPPEKSKDELWDECLILQEELDKEQKQMRFFQLEGDQAQRSWEASKRRLEETRARMRETLRRKQEAEECHRAEIQEFKQKLKQLEARHHSEIFGQKTAVIAATSQTRSKLLESELELLGKVQNFQADKREMELGAQLHIWKLKQKHQDELRGLDQSYEKKIREVLLASENRKKKKVKQETTQTELKEMFSVLRQHRACVVAEHDHAWSHINTILQGHHVEHLIPELLEIQLEAAQRRDRRLDRNMATAAQQKDHLTQSLQDTKLKLDKSRQELSTHRGALAQSWKKEKKMAARILEDRRTLYLKQQQLEMNYEQAQQEYEQLQERHTGAVLDMQQTSHLKASVLEGQIKTMTHVQEREQLRLWVALAFGQGDQTAAQNLKFLLESKEATVRALKDDKASKNFDGLMQELTTSCFCEEDRPDSCSSHQPPLLQASCSPQTS